MSLYTNEPLDKCVYQENTSGEYIPYPTSASGIIVLSKTSLKYTKLKTNTQEQKIPLALAIFIKHCTMAHKLDQWICNSRVFIDLAIMDYGPLSRENERAEREAPSLDLGICRFHLSYFRAAGNNVREHISFCVRMITLLG